ncbi:hypothetical protein [Nocardioides sp. WS12]|uniref:hypothetical protein n=1 Tax=Nocardioides sp. WS12 TaxID=2486272 RepID=UPI0015F8ADA2|nr:hypothetical protein [Nocardioides sp. WS12]
MSPTTPEPTATQFAMSTRVLSGTLMGALVFIGLACFFVLPLDETPPLWVPLAQLAAGIATHALLEAMGYHTLPLDPSLTSDDAAAQARAQWQSSMILRFALCESIAILSLALAFVLPEGGFLIYAGGALVALVLMVVHVWPWARPVRKFADTLESAGQASGLREAFGVLGASSGPIQRL